MAEETGTKRRGWLTILLFVLALIALGFATFALVVSWRAGRADDTRRVRDLAIAARNIGDWPETAKQIGRSNLYHRGKGGHALTSERSVEIRLRHPDLNDFAVKYFVPGEQGGTPASRPARRPTGRSCDQGAEFSRGQMTVNGVALSPEVVRDRAYHDLLRSASWFQPKRARGSPICFSVADLDLKSVTAVPAGFEHLLLAEVSADDVAAGSRIDGAPVPRGEIVAHIGDNRLPIRALAELPDAQPQLLNTVRALAQVASGGKAPAQTPQPKRVRRDALEPLNSSVAGTSYRFYFYPVTLPGGEYLLVGTVPRDAEAATFGRLGPRVMAFAVALLLLAALTPTLKLAMLGPVDGINRIEAGALVFGLLAAAAFATAALIATADVIGARNAASERLKESTAVLRARTTYEIHRVLLYEGESSIGALSRLLWSERSASKNGPSLIRQVPDGPGDVRDFLQPDALLPIAMNGRQPGGTVRAVARDMSGIGIELGDRPYFRRVLNADFAYDSEKLVEEVRRRSRQNKPVDDVWGCIVDGLVFEQVRSRADGVPKTLVGARVERVCLPPDLKTAPDRLQVLGVSLVLKSLLAPPLHAQERFAVLDASEGVASLPVLFHSERGRAGVELLADALDGPARRGFTSATAARPKCERVTPSARADDVETFAGTYEGVENLFAAARLPCTDWIVVTFVPRDLVDSHAIQAATHAMAYWAGGLALLIVLFLIVNAVKRALHDRPAWLWLWPDPAKRDRYRLAVPLLASAATCAALLALWKETPLLAALAGPVLAGATLYAVLLGPEHARALWSLVRPRTPEPPEQPAKRPVLDTVMERHVRWVIALLILSACVVPMMALWRDASAYFDGQQVGSDLNACRASREQERRAIEEVALVYRKAAREAPAPARGDTGFWCATRPAFASISEDPGTNFTNTVRRNMLNLDQHSSYGDPASINYPRWSPSDVFTFLGVLLLLGGVLLWAFRSALRGLFGFGVVLEAVDYPKLPTEPPDAAACDVTGIAAGELPARFVAVAAPDGIRGLLEELAGGRVVDLFAATEENPPALKAPDAKDGASSLMLFKNLEMLMRNRERRLKALAILERSAARQGRDGRAFKIGLVTDLSPLDRLLQSYERDAEDLERLAPDERHARRAELAGEREDVRWSRLFESFTTFTYRATKRTPMRKADVEPGEWDAVSVVQHELAYLPDHVVAAVMPNHRAPLTREKIADWAKRLQPEGPAPRAIEDYLNTQLIEHYQLAWSASSHAERLLLHRYAHDQLVNVGEAYALRSLVRRGLVVLDPAPRLMNGSFARFIRHAEEPRTLERWRGKEERGAWQKLRYPLMIALPFAMGVTALIAVRSGESLAALLPLAVSVGPALVNFFSGGRRAAG